MTNNGSDWNNCISACHCATWIGTEMSDCKYYKEAIEGLCKWAEIDHETPKYIVCMNTKANLDSALLLLRGMINSILRGNETMSKEIEARNEGKPPMVLSDEQFTQMIEGHKKLTGGNPIQLKDIMDHNSIL